MNMQSTYTPGNLTTVVPGGGGVVGGAPSGDDFVDMARLLFQRRMMAADRAKIQRPQKAAVMHAPMVATDPNALGGGADWQDEQFKRRMQQLELKRAEERSRPAPTKTFFSMNASSNPNGPARVIDWTQASIGNMPASGGFAQSPQQATAGDQMVSSGLRDRFDATTAAGEMANSAGMSPNDAAFEQQLRRLLAARGR